MSFSSERSSAERTPVQAPGAASERMPMAQDIQRSQKNISKLCEIIASLPNLEEELAAQKISLTLFGNLQKLANIRIAEKDWGKWQETVQKLSSRLSNIARKTPEGRLHTLREWHRLDEIEACDAEAVRLLSPNIFSKEERIDIRMKLHTLANGKLLRSKVLGDEVGSTNAPSRYHLDNEDGTALIAYAKSRLQEGAFKLERDEITTPTGEKTSAWNVYQQTFDPKTNVFDWKKEEALSKEDTIRELFRIVTSEQFQEAVRAHIAEKTGATPDTVPYTTNEFNARIGILPGEMTVREWAVSRLDLLLGLKLVPLTVIRPDANGDDIASVQESVASTDPQEPAREITSLESLAMFQNPPSEWTKLFPHLQDDADEESDPFKKEPVRSIVRAGALAFLVGDLDGIERNCMIDPVTGKVSKIDNGLGLGLVTGEQIECKIPQTRGSKKMVDIQHGDRLRSVPLELMMQHGLMIDEEARTHLEQLYTKLQAPGRERTHVLKILSVLFDTYGKKMTEHQFNGFMERLEQIVRYGRPVGLVKGVDYMNELEQVVAYQKRHARQAA